MYMDTDYSHYIYNSLSNIGYKYNYSNVKFMLEFSFLIISLLNDYITLNPCYISQSEFYEYMIEDLFDYLKSIFVNNQINILSYNHKIHSGLYNTDLMLYNHLIDLLSKMKIPT